MSSLWYQSDDGVAPMWQAIELSSQTIDLADTLHLPMRIVPFGDRAGAYGVALLVAEGHSVWVNGRPVPAGIKVLSHRDEVLAGGRTIYFSDESLPAIRVFALAPNQRRPRCAVCRMAIEDGQTVVGCPRCGRLFHQAEDAAAENAKACWTYRAQCLCGHPTGLDASAVWRPEKELEGVST